MNSLTLTLFGSLAAYVAAAPSGHGVSAVVSGPSGVVTGHGAIGPIGSGLGWGGWGGHGGAVVAAAPVLVGHGGWGGWGLGGHGLGLGLGGGHGLGLGLGGGHGLGLGLGYGHGIIGTGIGTVVTNGGGVVDVGHHGVSVKGPPTVPAVVAGPAGKIVADGLYGVPTHGGHGW